MDIFLFGFFAGFLAGAFIEERKPKTKSYKKAITFKIG